MAKVRDYKKEHKVTNSRPKTLKDGANRKRARKKLTKAGVKVKGKDVDHKDGNPQNNSKGNLRAVSKSKNRAAGGRKGSKAGKAAGGRKSSGGGRPKGS